MRFSHDYFKLPDGIKSGYLFAVELLRLENQTNHFLEYDASFPSLEPGESKEEHRVLFEPSYYPLPEKGSFLLLCFISDSGAFFTTLRRWTPQKEEYYRGLLGSRVEIEVWEDEPEKIKIEEEKVIK